MIYVYPEKNLRAYPGVERGSQEWDDTYKIRVMLKDQSTTLKTAFVSQTEKQQMKKHFMQIYFLRVSLNY